MGLANVHVAGAAGHHAAALGFDAGDVGLDRGLHQALARLAFEMARRTGAVDEVDFDHSEAAEILAALEVVLVLGLLPARQLGTLDALEVMDEGLAEGVGEHGVGA